MKYSASINSLLHYFRDTSFWQLQQYSNELHNYREDISGQWSDHAADEVNKQYLIFHEEDQDEMKSCFESQCQLLQKLTEKLNEVETVNHEILSLSVEIAKLINDCDEDLRRAVTNYDFSSNRRNDAESKIPNIRGLIDAANSGER